MAPCRDMDTARRVLDAGAERIYLGLSATDLSNLNFSGRGDRANVPDTDELRRIVEMAHSRDVDVDYTVNTPLLTDELEDAYAEHVLRGVGCGVDGLIVADWGAFEVIRELGIGLPLTASVLLNTLNSSQAHMLREMGASRVVAPFKLTLPELSELREAGLQVEVFGALGCSHVNGTCHMFHSMGESLPLGLPCRANYRVSPGNDVKPVLDAGQDCSICSLPDLQDAGVWALKIIGRDLPADYVENVVETYRIALDMAGRGAENDELRNVTLERWPMWGLLCETGRCKYGDTPITRSYV